MFIPNHLNNFTFMIKNRRIFLFTILLSISLIGLLVLQFSWISNALDQSEKDLDATISKSLNKIAKDIEDNSVCLKLTSNRLFPKNSKIAITVIDEKGAIDTLPMTFNYVKDSVQLSRDFNILDFDYPIEIQNNMKITLLVNDSTNPTAGLSNVLSDFYPNGTDKRVDQILLDSLLKVEFETQSIGGSYHYAIYDPTNRLYFVSDSLLFNEDLVSYELPIYLNGEFESPHLVRITFPDKNKLVWKNLWFVIISSIVLLIILIFLFIAFIKMVFELKKLNEARTDFTNAMTHEFKTPVSNITLSINALRKQSLSSEQLSYIDIIEEEKDRLHDGIDLVLTSALIEKNQLLLNKELVQIEDLIKLTVQKNALKIESKTAKIRFDFDLNSKLIYLDKHHVLNLFDNLLNNALQYSNSGVEIVFTTAYFPNYVEIAVSDTGHGISPKNITSIFDKFYRIPSINKYDTQGYGIGLYYVKMIVESHEGTIKVTSVENSGTTFRLQIPF